ncbi:SDR family NAD(P)-dependent oxidoreductase [Actinokineospora pegani]|uniref:SDR family NAD(P)-dependent oxidoreductase n=1 Tax=Actinokineospora pegani TaxID=2654637 RepID=UPI0012EA24D0|nr:SDR family NAD(P)-dependent oxidoreductase [Actinokineospora pegani]
MENLKAFILEQFANKQIGRDRAKGLLLELSGARSHQDIAVIGLAGRFAAAKDVREFWDFLRLRKPGIRDFPKARKDEIYETLRNPYYTELILGVPVYESDLDKIYAMSGYLDRIDHFDSRFFGIPPLEADYMDPYQRIALEVAYEALENAGYGGDSAKGTKTGVFLGRDQTNISYYRMISEGNPMQLSGSWEGLVASRISYQMDFKGPCLMTDTACSAGAVTIHQAVQSLMLGECDMALAGGLNLTLGGETKSDFMSGMTMDSVTSDDSTVRTFDARANGTQWGEGAGIVLLKPLERALADGDHIRAVIKASAINNDGASNSITAPNAVMQEQVIQDAWAKLDFSPETITYVEAHGTGTVLGDPIEAKGLTNAFRKHTSRKQFCGIGSLKTTMGHMVAASGAAAVVKVVKALEDKVLAPSANFDVPNPYINFTDSPLYVNDRLSPWETGGEPRRAAINSFGFIRTNCHLVLEEAPRYESAPQHRERYCLTASAKTEDALRELLDGYSSMLADCPWSLADICHTANLGRGHYEHRVLVVAGSKEQLAESIARLGRDGLGTDAQRGIFHGVHTVVSDRKTDLGQGDITGQAVKRLSNTANARLAAYRAHGDSDALTELAEAYVRGAQVEFAAYYEGETRKRVPLPTYPLEKTRHWAKPMKTRVQGFGGGAEHPLLGKEVSRTDAEVVFENTLSVERHWVLSDHRIDHRAVVPGTTYLEMARAAFAAVENTQHLRFENVFFRFPLAVEDGVGATVRTRLDRLDGGYAFQVQSRRDGEWVAHVDGRVFGLRGSEAEPMPVVDVAAPQRTATEVMDPFDGETDTGVFQFGPRWDSVRAVWKGEAQTLAKLRVPDGVDSETGTYGLHPAKLDNAVNLTSQNSGQTFLPYLYKNFVLHRPMPETFYSLIRTVRDDSRDGETITYDVDLLDEQGRPFGRITDYTVKKVDWERFSLDGPRRFVEAAWAQAPDLDATAGADAVWAAVVHDSDEGRRLVEQVRARGHRIVPCFLGAAADPERDVLAADEDGLRLLCERLVAEQVHGVLFATDATAAAGLTHAQRRSLGVDALFELYRGMVAHRVKPVLGLKVLGRDAWPVVDGDTAVDPYSAATAALAVVIGQEHQRLLVDAVDAGGQEDLAFVLRETLGGHGSALRALRGSQTYVRELRYVEAPEESEGSLYAGGTFLVTGGAGGLGLAIAGRMAEEGAERVVLLGRRELDEPTAERVAALGVAEYHRCDVSRAAEVARLGERLWTEGVRFTGIVHAAGVAGDGFLATKERADFDAVLAPKVDGGVALVALAKDHPGAFLVFFSSITAIMGGQGQGDYCGANAFLDSLAAKARAEGVRALSVNWPTWTEVGMAADYGVGDDAAPFTAVGVRDGLAWLDHFLRHPGTGAIPSSFNLPVLRQYLDELPFQLHPSLRSEISGGARADEASGGAVTEARLIGLADPTPTQLRVGAVYATVLGLAEIDVFTTFQDMGGNSLMTSQLLSLIDEAYPGAVDIADLFSYSTIADLAAYIDERVGPPVVLDEKQATADQSLMDVLDEIDDPELTALFGESDGGGVR